MSNNNISLKGTFITPITSLSGELLGFKVGLTTDPASVRSFLFKARYASLQEAIDAANKLRLDLATKVNGTTDSDSTSTSA